MQEHYHEDFYLTLARKSEGLLKERGSKFLAFAFPVKNEEEIRQELQWLQKTYYDASHHCYAWVLGKDGANYRANEDGEPNHSAGDPILGQIRSHHLTNVLLVVVRYFGGTKLGVGGLVQAYKSAAAIAIEANDIIEEYVWEEVSIHFPYPSMNEVMKVVKKLEVEISSQTMELDCAFSLKFRAGLKTQVLESLESIEGLNFQD